MGSSSTQIKIEGHGVGPRKKKSFSCQHCDYVSGKKTKLTRHLKTHTGETPYSCDICPKTYRRSESLRVHSRIHSGERPYSCPLCDKKFADRSALRPHIHTHTGERPFSCSMCGRTFVTKGDLKNHQVLAHLDSSSKLPQRQFKHKCKFCGKRFYNKTEYTRHLMVHTGKKPITCSICCKGFIDNYHMNRHRQVHRHDLPQKSKSTPCKNDKTKSLCKVLQTVDNHEVKQEHDTETPTSLVVSVPKVVEPNQDNDGVMDHIDTDEKPFPCIHCGICFMNPDMLANHLKIHVN